MNYTATSNFGEGPEPAPDSNATAVMFAELRELDHACGPNSNKHDRVTILIHACIDHGMNTRARIVGALKALGYLGRGSGRAQPLAAR